MAQAQQASRALQANASVPWCRENGDTQPGVVDMSSSNSSSNEFEPLVPVTPNESGETLCVVRWMVETPNGWVGAYNKGALEALFQKVETHERTD